MKQDNFFKTEAIWSQEFAKTVDRLSQELVPELLLMEHAGLAIKEQVVGCQGLASDKIVIVAGSGNNGGDALVVARLLADYQPDVVLVDDGMHSVTANRQLQMVRALHINIFVYRRNLLQRYADQQLLIIDGLVGLGLRAPLRDDLSLLITEINNLPRKQVIAIDLPTGLQTDSAKIDNAVVQADYTVTFGGKKPSQVLAGSKDFCGSVTVAEIGFPAQIIRQTQQRLSPLLHELMIEPLLACQPFAGLPASAHKYQRGHVLVIGGSRGKYGAPLMSGLAALRGGAGWVSVAVDSDQQPMVLPLTYEDFFREATVAVPELKEFVSDRQVRVIIIGPGTVEPIVTDELWDFFVNFTAGGGRVVIDAAATNGLLASNCRATDGIILLPHAGEWRKLPAEPVYDLTTIAKAKKIAEHHGVTLIYKDASPIVFAQQTPIYICPFGRNNLAKAGSGDLLAGLVGAYLLRPLSPVQAFAIAYAKLATVANNNQFGDHGLIATDLLTSCSTIDKPVVAT